MKIPSNLTTEKKVSTIHVGLMDFDLAFKNDVFTYRSNRSLTDFDIVVWDIRRVHASYSEKPDSPMPQLLNDHSRRSREIKTFVEAGGLLVVLLSKARSFSTGNGPRIPL